MSAVFRDERGVERLRGTITNGGSTPGTVAWKEFVWTEPAGPHADMSATMDIEAGTTILDIVFYWLVNTAADEVHLTVGDTAHPSGYIDDLRIGPGGYYGDYDPASGSSNPPGATFDQLGNIGADYIAAAYIPDNPQGQQPGARYGSSDTLTFTVSGIATGGGGASLLIRVLYSTPQTPGAFA